MLDLVSEMVATTEINDGKLLQLRSQRSQASASLRSAKVVPSAEVGSPTNQRVSAKSHSRASQFGRASVANQRISKPPGHVLPRSATQLTVHYAHGAEQTKALDTVQEQSFIGKASRFHEDQIAPICDVIVNSRYLKILVFSALVCAVFLPTLWVIINQPHNNDLDIALSVVLGIFSFEMVLRCMAFRGTYLFSFLCLVDLLAVISVLFDLSYTGMGDVANALDTSANFVQIHHTLRFAQIGIEAARISKLMKFLRFLPGLKVDDPLTTAQAISTNLTTKMSNRTSCMVIALAILMPTYCMWQYPEEDWSIRSMIQILEKGYSRNPELLEWQLTQLAHFYDEDTYYPWRITFRDDTRIANNHTSTLPWISSRGPPTRSTNNHIYKGEFFVIEFNFKTPNQSDAAMRMTTFFVIIATGFSFAFILSRSVTRTVLDPSENLLSQVRDISTEMLKIVAEIAFITTEGRPHLNDKELVDDVVVESKTGLGFEADLLNKVVTKLCTLKMHRTVLDSSSLQGLGDGDLDLIRGFEGKGIAEDRWWEKMPEMKDGLLDENRQAQLLQSQLALLQNRGLELALIETWNFNPFELDSDRNIAAVTFFLGPQNHGFDVNSKVLSNFIDGMKDGYSKSCAYHNWFHAVDVTHAVARLMEIFSAPLYLKELERFGLLVSAISHDIGHPGLNNTFLIETSHEIALRYNDISPLENMHCAKLFDVLNKPNRNVFEQLTKKQFQEVRQVCIDAILHTDNAQHFVLLKEVQLLYELNSDVCDPVRQLWTKDQQFILSQQAQACFRTKEAASLLLKLFLHLADISNCWKPFQICRIWALQAAEELFMQGEAEQRLGVPMQALNERQKVNLAFSQIGFIEFLVSPLLFAVIKVLPPIQLMADETLKNARTWQQHWEKEKNQSLSKQAKRSLDDRLTKIEQRYFAAKL